MDALLLSATASTISFKLSRTIHLASTLNVDGPCGRGRPLPRGPAPYSHLHPKHPLRPELTASFKTKLWARVRLNPICSRRFEELYALLDIAGRAALAEEQRGNM